VAVVVKLGRSVPAAARRRSFGRLALGLALAAVVVAGLVGGIAWVGSGRLLTVGSLTILTLHAWAGLVLVPVVAAHVLPGRWRLFRPGSLRTAGRRGVSRRSVLAAAALGGVAVAGYGVTNLADLLAGGRRRFTGSRWLPGGSVPPATTFIADVAPALDPAAWRLRVSGRVARPVELSLGALAALGARDAVAVLDCTSGWAVESVWRGAALSDVLAAAGGSSDGRRAVVRSATGWASSFDLAEADRLLLATAVAGQPLPAANGAPCRLVAPEHRGLEWVKWVTEVEVV
jgi:DMSO/TMAO reductase YedYZ molybdopterin-dependent catalytic subunit